MASTSNPQGSQSAPILPQSSRKQSNTHVVQRRIFIGPMPEKVIAHTEAQRRRTKLTLGSMFSLSVDADKAHNGDKSEEVYRLLKENAYRFFLHEGGNAEDWGEEEEQDVLDELLKRWKESEWGQLWSRRHHRRKNEPQNAGSNQWFGTSFEIGTLMGVNILQGQEHTISTTDSSSKNIPPGNTSSSLAPTVTAKSTLAPSNVPQVNADVVNGDSETTEAPTPASSSTGLLHSRTTGPTQVAESGTSSDNQQKAKSEVPLRPALCNNVSKYSAQTNVKPRASAKGKDKVRYADSPLDPPPTPRPLLPEEVLERTSSTVDFNTSSAATIAIDANIPDSATSYDFRWGDVAMRDRMLVRVSYTRSEGIIEFDDAINRTTRDLHYEDWGEFLVAWRKDSIEIYRDHNTPGKEWVTGHKHLSYVIPLRSSRTRLALYSFVDLTFCITCAPTTTRLNPASSRWIFSREKEGTNIFIFKLKSRSRAYDWTWQLWRQMGGHIPRTVDIHNPRLSTKVTIDIPESEEVNNDSLYRLFRRENIIELCIESLRSVPDWNFMIENKMKDGRSLQLAWRVKANLDWIWLEDDVSGHPRDWAVLCGFAFRQFSIPPVLEIRVAEHAPTHIHLKNGKHIDEPPAIEGYLERIRSNTQTKQQSYLATHNGYLFTLNTYTPFPPMPPGLVPAPNLYTDAPTLRHTEIRRGTNQIMMATGMLDLRLIVAVRRAFQPAPVHMHNQKDAPDDDSAWFDIQASLEERTPDDEEDEGGEGGITKSGDRGRTRIRRSFELLLNTGHVIRFEAHSCRVAIEWIERLRALTFYWKRRHRIDAKEEIELAQAQRPRLTPQTRVCQDGHETPPEAPADLSAPYAAIDSLYNRCVLEGCKPIVKGGRIYMKKGLHGQYKLVQLFLVAGHLVRFRIGLHSALYPSMRKKINLLDAYVFSGYFAAQTLPKGQYMPNANLAPRRYQDGLETDDREEDMLFIIWYRSHSQMINADQDPTTTAINSKSVPGLSVKHKMLVFKTRSVLERDAWCWALNSEIEKIVRAQKEREERLRETGNLVKLD